MPTKLDAKNILKKLDMNSDVCHPFRVGNVSVGNTAMKAQNLRVLNVNRTYPSHHISFFTKSSNAANNEKICEVLTSISIVYSIHTMTEFWMHSIYTYIYISTYLSYTFVFNNIYVKSNGFIYTKE